MMNLTGQAKRVRVYIGELQKADYGHQPLWEALLTFLRDQGAAGATVMRGMAGFGAHSRIHMARLADIVPDLPVVLEWVDDAARVERLLPRVAAMVRHGTVTVEDVLLVKHQPAQQAGEGGDPPT